MRAVSIEPTSLKVPEAGLKVSAVANGALRLVPPTTSARPSARLAPAVPLRLIWLTQRLECAPYESPTEPEAREISSMATQCSR